jgi:hypothetical protein
MVANSKVTRRSGRSKSKQTQQSVTAMYCPRKIRCPADPPPVQASVRVTKTVQNVFDIPSSGGFILTCAGISEGIPGGFTYWDKMRVQSVKAWLPAGANIGLLCRVDATDTSPRMEWSDLGTQGAKRPGIAFELGLLDQAKWRGTATIDPICHFFPNTTADQPLTVQVVVELLSPALI